MADAIIIKNITGYCITERKSLSACIEFYNIEMPIEKLNYLRIFESQDLTLNSPWTRRPMPSENFMEFGTLQVKYLLTLREVQMQRMMEKFNRCVEECLDIANEEYNGFWFRVCFYFSKIKF